MHFSKFNFSPTVLAGVKAANYTTPTPIQEQAIPVVMEGKDVLGLAQTGTGKTAAFALPILQRLSTGPRGVVRALIVAPTRELAEQIRANFATLGEFTGLRAIAVYGGVSSNAQAHGLRGRAEIVVACPGRLLDHMGQGNFNPSHVEVLVLDEADQMFDMGFLPDIRKIISRLPRTRQNLLFSATMPKELEHLTREVLKNPATVSVARNEAVATVTHALYPVVEHLKLALLLELIRRAGSESILVFTRTKHRAKRVAARVKAAGWSAADLQGNLSQNRRQAAMQGFREGKIHVLVATDIAARGIDVSQITHVINYDITDTPEAYIHRIGRTGRAAKTGDAYTLITREDEDMVSTIQRKLGARIERRTLDGFDYNAPAHQGTGSHPPAASGQGQGMGQSSSPQPQGHQPHQRHAPHGPQHGHHRPKRSFWRKRRRPR
jgi:ATP-dependent RNA helicase RhlE